MAKLTRDEFIKKYNDMFSADDYIFDKENLSIELMEDISDSISEGESEELSSLRSEIERKDTEIKDLKRKYKERFLNAISDDKEEVIEELKEEEVIDVKEI